MQIKKKNNNNKINRYNNENERQYGKKIIILFKIDINSINNPMSVYIFCKLSQGVKKCATDFGLRRNYCEKNYIITVLKKKKEKKKKFRFCLEPESQSIRRQVLCLSKVNF